MVGDSDGWRGVTRRNHHIGLHPGRNVDIGDLDDTEFSDRGVEYAIDSLIHKEVGSINQLVLETSTGLPDDLIFEVDGERYAISDADALGLHKDIHVWWLDSGLGWSDGGDDDGEADATAAVQSVW